MPSSVPTSARAFPSTPYIDRYFGSESSEAARRRLTACIERGEGPALLVGAAGCGKTMLLEVLAKSLEKSFRVVRLAGQQVCTRRALLQSILHRLDEVHRGLDDGEMRLSLNDTLTAVGAQPVALLVDEAQTLPVRLLEELRLLSAVVVDGEPRVTLVLAGTNRLDEAFTSPELDSFNQRIAARCYLTPLTRSESIQYVRAHVAAAGGDPDALFTPDAYDALFRATDGTPRLLNQLGDRALVLAVERGEQLVTGDAIQEAWSDVHQLPAPWHTPSVVAPAADSETDRTEDSVAEALIDEAPESRDPLDDADDEPLEGIWNADTGLDAVADRYARDEDGEHGCVSYAFPSRPIEVDPNRDAPPADPPPTQQEAVAEFTPPAPTVTELVAVEDPDAADDPFEETFDEEEVVLDRFSKLDAVLRPGVARVQNRREVEFGRMFEALTPAVESLIEDVEATLDPTAEQSGLSVVATDVDEEPNAVGPEVEADDEPLLLVEEDSEEPAGEVVHREYTRLFSSLRQA